MKAKHFDKCMLIPSGESHVETSSYDEIHVPANSKSSACIIRLLTNSKVLVKCLWCGNEFETYYCKIKAGRGKYCSKKCVGYANGSMRLIDGKGIFKEGVCAGSKNPNWQGGDFQDCVICGKPFWKYPSRNQVTCSIECGGKRGSLVKFGHLSSIGHKGQYGGRSWGHIRKTVIDRDNYTCQDCGKVYIKNSAFLHVHHLTKLSVGGSNALSNLVTLCKNCHAFRHRYDRIVKDIVHAEKKFSG